MDTVVNTLKVLYLLLIQKLEFLIALTLVTNFDTILILLRWKSARDPWKSIRSNFPESHDAEIAIPRLFSLDSQLVVPNWLGTWRLLEWRNLNLNRIVNDNVNDKVFQLYCNMHTIFKWDIENNGYNIKTYSNKLKIHNTPYR